MTVKSDEGLVNMYMLFHKFNIKTFSCNFTYQQGHPRLITALGKLYTMLMKREIDPLSEVSDMLDGAKRGNRSCVKWQSCRLPKNVKTLKDVVSTVHYFQHCIPQCFNKLVL